MKSFLALLEEGVKQGEFHPVQPLETIVNFMVNIWDGLILMAHVEEPERVAVGGQLEALNLYLIQALRPDENADWHLDTKIEPG